MSADDLPACSSVTIVGGGYSAATAAVQLVRASEQPVAITIVEPGEEVGRGLAYSTTDADHRLNGTLENHLLDPADPGHFARWCADQQIAVRDPDAIGPHGTLFVRRHDFGRFVAETVLAHAHRPATGSSLRHVRALATDACRDGGAFVVRLDDGEPVVSDMLLVATGNAPPRLPLPFTQAMAAHPCIVARPSDGERVRAIPRHASVLVIGSGLTSLDVISTLVRGGHAGRITAVSRRGLRPREQRPPGASGKSSARRLLERINGPVASFIVDAGRPPSARALLHALRRQIRHIEAQGETWHAAFDDLRDVLWQVWPMLSPEEKKRALRQLRPWYDAHRFRSPPQNEALVREAEARGLVAYRAARVVSVQAEADDCVRVGLRERYAHAPEIGTFDVVINCTGLDAQPAAAGNPFLSALLRRGWLRIDDSGIGFAVDGRCCAIDAAGRSQSMLRVIGPPTAGSFGDPIGALFIAAQVQRIMPDMLAAIETTRQAALRQRV